MKTTICLLACLLVAVAIVNRTSADESGRPLPITASEAQKIASAKVQALRSPVMQEVKAEYSAAFKAYRLDRAKFPANRDRDVAIAYGKVKRAYETALRKAMLTQNPGLAPLLARADAAAKLPNPALQPIKDAPGLPRVLLIGDSISIGYTLPVRKQLAGVANVHRIPTNGGATDVGLERMKSWLGDGNWDVIHFNFGVHDAKYQSETTLRSTHAQYEANLRTLVKQMQATGAKVIFATTTPVPKGGVLSPTRRFDSIPERNKVALRVMKEYGVAIDDLYTAVLPVMDKVGRENDLHFQPEGYEFLAKFVAASIQQQLPKK